jgi:hypothetical protein
MEHLLTREQSLKTCAGPCSYDHHVLIEPGSTSALVVLGRWMPGPVSASLLRNDVKL